MIVLHLFTAADCELLFRRKLTYQVHAASAGNPFGFEPAVNTLALETPRLEPTCHSLDLPGLTLNFWNSGSASMASTFASGMLTKTMFSSQVSRKVPSPYFCERIDKQANSMSVFIPRCGWVSTVGMLSVHLYTRFQKRRFSPCDPMTMCSLGKLASRCQQHSQ